jgi:hypothetical protein
MILDGFDAEEVGSRYVKVKEASNGAVKTWEIKKLPSRWTEAEFQQFLETQFVN